MSAAREHANTPVEGHLPFTRQALDERVVPLPVKRRRQRQVLLARHQRHELVLLRHVWILREGGIAWQGELDQLKESTVRLVLRAEHEILSPPVVPGQIHGEVRGSTAVLVVRDWNPDRLPEIERQSGARVEVTPLTLEDIFLAVHS